MLEEKVERSRQTYSATRKYQTTQQSVKINGATIPLTAKAGTMLMRDENTEPIALFGFTSYTKDGASNRPIIC
ncbi:MAG: hypothetical protein U5K54_13895 [Cytophagales bacterium]|nr:hypothetical protein [Cytophagales bacterium]